MRLNLTLTTVAVKTELDLEIEVERKIDAAGVIDAAEGVTNKAIRQYRCASFSPCSFHTPYNDLQHCYNEIPFIQEFRPLTICRSLTSLWLNLWDEKQRKMVKFDTGKELKSPFGQPSRHKGFPTSAAQ